MSIFGNIMSAIFGKAQAQTPTGTDQTTLAPGSSPDGQVDVEAAVGAMAAKKTEKLDWRRSIVDLMKVLDLDSSLASRKQLAQELGYTGALDGSAEMNIALHKAVMKKLSENGGKVPESMKN